MMITVTVDGLPKMANGGHESWMAASKRKKLWKNKMAKVLVGLAPTQPWQKIQVRFIRCSTTEPDFDGLVHGFKPVRDALVLFGFVVDDGPRHMFGEYRWEKAPRGKGHIRVELQELI